MKGAGALRLWQEIGIHPAFIFDKDTSFNRISQIISIFIHIILAF